jgi:hypothetical protein
MEFLFQNPFLILILLAYLFSLFGKRKKQQAQQQRNSQPRHVQTKRAPAERGSELKRQLDTAIREFKNLTENRQYTEQAESVQPVEQDKNELKEQSENRKPKAQAVKREAEQQKVSVSPSKPVEMASEKEEHVSLAPTDKQLVEGIIWSEILGPPRSLNPHRSVRNHK